MEVLSGKKVGSGSSNQSDAEPYYLVHDQVPDLPTVLAEQGCNHKASLTQLLVPALLEEKTNAKLQHHSMAIPCCVSPAPPVLSGVVLNLHSFLKCPITVNKFLR